MQDVLSSNPNDVKEVDDSCGNLYAAAKVTSATLLQFEMTCQKRVENETVLVSAKEKSQIDRYRKKKKKERKHPISVKKETQKAQYDKAIEHANEEWPKRNGHTDVWICEKAWEAKGKDRGYKDSRSLLSKFNRHKKQDVTSADKRER